MSGPITGKDIRGAVGAFAATPMQMPLDQWCKHSRVLLAGGELLDTYQREIASLTHHYTHHREAGVRLHNSCCELREALREALAGWDILLGLVPDAQQAARVAAIRAQFGLDEDPT